MHLLLMMQVAGKVIPVRDPPAEELLHLIQVHSVTTLSGVGAHCFSELLRESPRGGNINSLARVGVHGVALRADLVKDIHARFPGVELGTGYGLTETSGSISLATSVDFEQRPGTSGAVVPSVEIQVVDENGRKMPAGALGDIELRGAMLMSGYCNPPEANARAFRDGWFRTGDVGSFDNDGFLTVSDRRGHLIRLAGKVFSGSEIERVAIESGLVADAAALQISTASGTERLLLAVVAAPETLDPGTSLGQTLNDSLGVAPGLVTILPMQRLPRLQSGKLDRLALQAEGTTH